MSIEAAVVISGGSPSHWHLPPGRNSVYIPDTRDLWDILWESRSSVDGVAHTHPGSGWPSPSKTDLTTFEAVEKGLGRRLSWWILSRTHCVLLQWESGGFGPGYETTYVFREEEPSWAEELRRHSYPEMTVPGHYSDM